MGDDGDVLRFRSREGLDPPDEYDREPVPRDASYDGYESYDRFEMYDRELEQGHTVAACRCPLSVTCSLPSTWSPSRCGCRSVG